MFETNEILVEEFQNSKFAGEAFINIGNKHYNSALDKELEQTERIRLFRLAIDNYERAIASPGLSDESKGVARGFRDDTASFLAHNEYQQADDALRKAGRAGKKSDIEAAIDMFKSIAKDYHTTKYGDLAYGKLGDAYTMLADKEEHYFADALYYYRFLPIKYNVESPGDAQVKDAIDYCSREAAEVQAYMKAKNIPERQAPPGDN